MTIFKKIQECKKITFLSFILLHSNLSLSDTLIHAGNLIDTNNGEISKAVTIRIIGNKINDITKGYAWPKDGDEIVDLKDSFVLPGFMDMHVHLSQEYAPKAEREPGVEPEYLSLIHI